MAAAEISYDKDWIRYRVSAFTSAIRIRATLVPAASTRLSIFRIAGASSALDREGIRFLGPAFSHYTGKPHSSLRSSKGKASQFRPIREFLANAGADFDHTPKLRGFANFNFSGSNAREREFLSSRPHPSDDGETSRGRRVRPP